MDYTQLNRYKQQLHQQTLSEILQKNEEQIKNWTNYQEKHKSVLEGLQILPLELSVNCLVPIGNQAFMKGKLKHTNEILVCLGDGYFVNYSASQAIELAKRRIKRTEDILKRLQDERNLFESRQNFPLYFGGIGDNIKEDLIEHWDEQDLEKWRVEHRQREKEYHTKKAQQKQEEEKHLSAEEELFRRLDELELEEELADEYYRTHENEDEDEEDDEDEDEDGEEGDTENQMHHEYKEYNEMKNERLNEKTESSVEEIENLSNLQLNDIEESSTSDKSLSLPISEETCSINGDKSIKNIENNLNVPNTQSQSQPVKSRRVSFLVPCDKDSSDVSKNGACTGNVIESIASNEYINYEDDEDIRKIHFSHSDILPQLHDKTNNIINHPGDIYNTVFKPKSILKRSKNDLREDGYIPAPVEFTVDNDIETENIGSSVYDDVVTKVVHEKKKELSHTEIEPVIKKKPVSRFRLERATLNK